MKLRHLLYLVPILLLPVSPAWGQGTLFVQGNNVGVGVASPLAPFHISADGSQSLQFILENQGPPGMRFSNATSGATWFFRQNSFATFVISREGTGGDEFRLKSNGEFQIGPGGANNLSLDTSGNLTIAGSLSQGSSRQIKQDFASVDADEVLSRVTEMPITSWSYKADGASVRHIGPMAEDFHSAFGLGVDERHLSPGDVASVALVAVQGLQKELQSRDARIAQMEQEIADLKKLVEKVTSEQTD